MRKLLATSFILSILWSCNDVNNKKANIKDVITANMDTSANPKDDFFAYANGGWIKSNQIPNEESEWGIGNLVINENLSRLRIINENAAKEKAAEGTASQKIGDFWSAAMDSSTIERNGITALKPYLDEINTINNIPTLVKTAASLNVIGVASIFDDNISQDDKNSSVMAYKLWQGGIGLPERDYYFKKDSQTVNIRNEYVKYISKILTMIGQDPSASNTFADHIMAMETALASRSRKIEDLRDPYKNYHKIAINDLTKISSTIDWKTYLNTIGIKNIDSVIIGQPEFFNSLDSLLKNTSISDWQNYLRFRLVRNFSSSLPEAYGETTFNFTKLLNGAKERKPRWKRVIQSEEDVMGELLGQLYVKQYFDETAKKRYVDLVENIRDAYKVRIQNLSWMSDSTKQKALLKLSAIKKKVGYPDKWKDFSAMKISRNNYTQNLINANIWWHNRNTSKLGKPVDRDEWDMYPQTYNAYYNPSNNEIVLPAGIFTVPGFKDAELDDAVVYGYSGASTIGHEITHGFDDQGRLYDEKGNLKNWWSPKDSAEFSQRSLLVVKEFNEFEPLPGMKINGKATLGENIADLGGILLGIDAFKKTDQFKKNQIIEGQTPLQRFFMGYSLGWLGTIRDESLRSRLMTDVHSPAKYRVNGPFMNVDEFYSTFNIKSGDKMYRADSLRAHIW